MNTIARVMLVAVLALGSGCAKPDWIEQTLVTVDVTGTWRSTEGGLIELVLEEQGSVVKGTYRIAFPIALATISSGTIEGTVAGDVFRISRISGGIYGLQGEMTVNEDEMSGELRGPGFYGSRRNVTLRRFDSSPPPRSQ